MADLWTRDHVWLREVEAQDTICRLPSDRVAHLQTAWPQICRSFADAVGAEETRMEEIKEGLLWPKGWDRPSPPQARAIDRMVQVWDWHTRYLTDAFAIRILQGMARAQAQRRPLLQGVKFLKSRRWTAYRIRDKALDQIADGLNTARELLFIVAA